MYVACKNDDFFLLVVAVTNKSYDDKHTVAFISCLVVSQDDLEFRHVYIWLVSSKNT